MTAAHEPGHMLVVDDNRVNRLLLTHHLQQMGHTTETAENGREALDKLHSSEFDLMLLDIEMPVMNGYQTLEACRDDPELRELRVIMTSSLDELDSVVKCIEMGAEDYLVKPLNPILLKARVNASLEKKRLRDQQKRWFRTFATEEVADELMRNGFALGGKTVDATVMFADIRSFTTLSETHDPAVIHEMLNGYFSLMFGAIHERGGLVSQLLGDGFMAVFGAPIPRENHRELAVRAGLDMLVRLDEFNRRQEEQGGTRIRIGIGIASGPMIAGYTGSQERAIYTCIGDTVNLAARIEEYTKVAKRPLIIGRHARAGLPADMHIESLGEVVFKGKQQAVEVFAVG
ncbi:MAG: Adenylate cyclase 2 [Anaerolineales bacterium]|nr:Adenylate cyclase 2 [Anaerolineales bacterium]